MRTCTIFDRAMMLCDVPAEPAKADGLVFLIIILGAICWLALQAFQTGD